MYLQAYFHDLVHPIAVSVAQVHLNRLMATLVVLVDLKRTETLSHNLF